MAPFPELEKLIAEIRVLSNAGNAAAALRKTAEAYALARDYADPFWMAVVINLEARLRFGLGQYIEATGLADQALRMVPEKTEPYAEALHILGICSNETDNLNAGEDYLRRTVDLCRELGSYRLRVRALHNLSAGIYMPRGQFNLALATDQEALRIMDAQGLVEYRWGPLVTMAWVYWLTNQRANAYATLEQLRPVMQPGSVGEGYYYHTLANLATDQERFQEAAAHYEKCRSIAEDCGDPSLTMSVRSALSRLSRLTGDGSSARHWAQDALTLADRVGYHHMKGMAHIEMGRAEWACGDLAAAEAHLVKAEQILAPLDLNYDLARARLGLAALLVERCVKEAEGRVCLDEESRVNLLANITFIQKNGYGFLFELERDWTYPLVNACLESGDKVLVAAGEALIDQLGRVPAEPLRIHVLGAMQVWRGERLLPARDLRQRRAGELLALLALAPEHALTDEAAAEALAPESDLEAARNLVYHASSTLRRVLEAELPDRRFPSRYLAMADGCLRLYLPAGSTVDCLEFEEAARARDWERAHALYRGDFLADARSADWAVAWRERLGDLYSRVLLELAREELTLKNWDAALDFATRLLARDPWNEEGAAVVMRAYVGMNNPSGARKIYVRLCKTLRSELGVDPQAELQQLYESLTLRQK